MATTTFKPTINIKSSFTTIGAGFKKANKSVGSMRTILLKRTKIKRDAITGRKSLFGKRIENQRRKDEEAVVEASKPSAIGRIGNSVLNSGKGLFDRIVDFAGTLLVGWLVNNLPTIMTMAQDLMGRIQKTVNILGNFMRDIGGIFTGSTKVFGAVLTNITTLDFFDSNKRLSTALGELESVFDDMNKQFDDGLKTLTTPLGQMPGEAPVPPTGTDYTMPPEQVGRGGGGGTVSPQAVYAYLKQLGVSDIHALGILANIEGESGFTVGSQEKSGGGGIGLFQYTYPSRKAAFLRAVPDYKTNWKGQIDFAIKSDPNTPLYLRKQFSSPEEAADDFMRNWENPNKSVYAGRRRKHNAFIKSFKSGKLQPAQVSSAPSQTSMPQTSKGGKVVEYITGDRTSPRYAADHAGRNYHDHIGFDSQKTRDAAMAFLTGRGWTIGSVNTGVHANGSLHYKNLAFDIPFYSGNNTRKGVTDDAKGETKLSSMLRADLISGGFSGPQLGGGSGGSSAAVSATPGTGAMTAAGITPTSVGEDISIVIPNLGLSSSGGSGGGGQQSYGGGMGGQSLAESPATVLNNFVKNHLLVELAYL